MTRSRSPYLLAAVLLGLGGLLAWLFRSAARTEARSPALELASAPERSAPLPSAATDAEPLEHRAPEKTRSELQPASEWSVGSGAVQLSGRVADEHGAPLAGATVLVAEYDAAKPGLVSCLTDAQGRFEARGAWTSAQLIVRAIHPECWNSVHRTVARGADVELALEHGAELRGQLELQTAGPLPDLTLTLENAETRARSENSLFFRTQPESPAARVPGTFECTPEGAFTYRSLRPGHYSIVVHASGVAAAIARVDSIELRVGERWSGAQCNPLLLRPPQPVELTLEIGAVPGLGAENHLRLYFDPELEGDAPHLANRVVSFSKDGSGRPGSIVVQGYPDLPNALFVPGQTGRVQLFSTGKHAVHVFLERPSDDAIAPQLIPLESRGLQWIEIPEGARSAQLRFDLDPAQSAKLLAAAQR